MRQTVLLVFVDHNSEAKYRCEKNNHRAREKNWLDVHEGKPNTDWFLEKNECSLSYTTDKSLYRNDLIMTHKHIKMIIATGIF